MSTDFKDPNETLQLLDALEASGFTDEAFSVVHHHKEPMTIAAHRAYCMMLSEEGDTFQTMNNRLVQRRLKMILTMHRSAGFSSGGSKTQVFVHLAGAVLAEVPHDLRPVAEQYANLASKRGEA